MTRARPSAAEGRRPPPSSGRRAAVRARRARAVRGPRLGRRIAWTGAAAATLLAGYLLWLRDSSLVAVREVVVTGATAPDAAAIRHRLVGAGRGMTTLHVREGDLERAVSAYPVVRAVEARAEVPHRLVVHVVERRPVALLELGDGTAAVPVAADGTLLPRARADRLPRFRAQAPSAGARLRDPAGARLLHVAAGAPAALRARVRRIGFEPGRGIVVLLRRGPDLIFGDSRRVEAKWAAAVRVLLAAPARGAGYVDVRLPGSPAAGPADPDPDAVGGEGASGTGSTAAGGPASVADGMEGGLPPTAPTTAPPDAAAVAPDPAEAATAGP